MKDKPSFTDYLSILYKWKKFLIINLLIVGILTTAITFLIPEKFKSTSIIMIQDSDNSSLLGSISQNMGGVLSRAFGVGGAGNSEDKLFGFLDSRKFALSIINKFGLVEYYDVTKYRRDKTLKYFSEDFKADLTDNGFIELSMIHKDPQKAAEIVNFAVNQLDSINYNFSVTYAKKYREFVEKRYTKNLLDIEIAENNLETFQKKYGIYAIPEQLEYSFKALGELEANLALKEIEADFLSEVKGSNSIQYKNLNKEVNLLRKKINDIISGKHSTKASVIFLPLKNIPKLQKEYLSVKLDYELQTKLLEFTLPMYEQAVMEEQKNIPVITVVDEAIPAQLKYSPKKAIIILSVFFICLFLLIPTVFIGEKFHTKTALNKFEEGMKIIFNKIFKIYRLKE